MSRSGAVSKRSGGGQVRVSAPRPAAVRGTPLDGVPKRSPDPSTFRASYGKFEAFGRSKLQAREAVRLGVKTQNNRTGGKLLVPEDDLIEIEELKMGKPRMDGRNMT